MHLTTIQEIRRSFALTNTAQKKIAKQVMNATVILFTVRCCSLLLTLLTATHCYSLLLTLLTATH